MVQEAKGNFDRAEAIYEGLLKDNAANTLVAKRLVTIQLAKGNTASAVQLLNQYLLDSPVDMNAWLELAEIHMSVGNYDAAAFCYEELILCAPNNPPFHTRLAELYYTLAGGSSIEYLRMARKHFSRAIELTQPFPYARANMGLCLTTVEYAACKGSKGDAEINAALHNLGKENLVKAYKQADSSVASIAEAVLQVQAETLRK